MTWRQHKPRARRAAVKGGVVLRLYIVGGAPNSVQAVANLDAICREYLKDDFRLEVVDILRHPQRAMAEGVLVTPSLAKLSPLPIANVVGNLSDKAKVLLALGLERKAK
ncbi:MAG TPA: circadian clock KaiB family protein [Burkholderiales bacterium]|nr:circadian clock KaiB family protein [Burkholderiales bacterium]